MDLALLAHPAPAAVPPSLSQADSICQSWRALLEAVETPQGWSEAAVAPPGWKALSHQQGAYICIRQAMRSFPRPRTSGPRMDLPAKACIDIACIDTQELTPHLDGVAAAIAQAVDQGFDLTSHIVVLGSLPMSLCPDWADHLTALGLTLSQGLSRKTRWAREQQRARLLLALLNDPACAAGVAPEGVDVHPRGYVRAVGPAGIHPLRLLAQTRTQIRSICRAIPVSSVQCLLEHGVRRILATDVVHLDLGKSAEGLCTRRRCAEALISHAPDVAL